MAESNSLPLNAARGFLLQNGGRALTPAVAKLYSQHTRLTADRPGVNFWRVGEASDRLADAAHLIDASLVMKGADDRDWRLGMRRAGEILEWLSHPQFELHYVPTRLLSAAAYQLAGFPAMASSLLERGSPDSNESRLLSSLLKGDFRELLDGLADFWQEHYLQEATTADNSEASEQTALEESVLFEIAGALGVLCAQARWGGEQRFDRALQRLIDVCNFLMHSGDTYSWLLSRLVAEAARSLETSFLRTCLNPIGLGLSDGGRTALELYARYAYQSQRSVIWPSQSLGLSRLSRGESFALCTPTGSGKTTVAEVALLQSLFENDGLALAHGESITDAPLGMYLVPSKALAAEAESKLHRILSRVSIGDEQITVTGLYGGTDWGPTDAWLTREGRTVLICTYEKAEAILRFLGPLFLDRLKLVVIDEAHAVEFNGRSDELQTGESRALRLETLGTRLFTHMAKNNTRVIALSAVAGGMDNALASWVRGEDSTADTIEYRSTRQLIGRLECLGNRRFDIHYDLLDGAKLQFAEQGRTDGPFINNAIPPHPPVPRLENDGPEKRLRPHLFWAALNLVKSGSSDENATVLMFVPQQIGGYAEDLLSVLEQEWSSADLPSFFSMPEEPDKAQLWERCLNACADYFTTASREYRLLEKGIVVHHGRMPRLLSRLLVETIEQRIASVVLATSTLAEGVNLPFEVLLVPSLRRGQTDISPREFKNLVGRTGRPGVATEGRTLVLLPMPADDWSSKQARLRYYNTIGSLAFDLNPTDAGGLGLSPLAQLLIQLRENWERLDHKPGISFFDWLELTSPLAEQDDSNQAINSLDVLDSILLSAIVELEQIENRAIPSSELEGQLREIWQRTYAHFASSREEELAAIFVKRGRAIQENVYTEREQRRKLYKTSMPPRSAQSLIQLYSRVRAMLGEGESYAMWPRIEKFEFIRSLVGLVGTHPRFTIRPTLRSGRNSPRWDEILQWWLDPEGCERRPNAAQVSDWYNFVSQSFDYRFNWGLSSVLSLAIDETVGSSLTPLSLEHWPATGLPWISFWVKELIVWGTLDPVAAFLLSRRTSWTRRAAETEASNYYSTVLASNPNDYLNPSSIRQWIGDRVPSVLTGSRRLLPSEFPVELLRDFSNSGRSQWRVVPVENENSLVWLDPAGFQLAKSQYSGSWSRDDSDNFDFTLHHEHKVVRAAPYL